MDPGVASGDDQERSDMRFNDSATATRWLDARMVLSCPLGPLQQVVQELAEAARALDLSEDAPLAPLIRLERSRIPDSVRCSRTKCAT